MTLPSSLMNDVVQLLRKSASASIEIKGFTPASGGCINNGGKLSTTHGEFFIKWNDALRYPRMFETEANGLKILATSKAVHVPSVIATGESHEIQFILLEFIRQQSQATKYWEEFGRQLAMMHRKSKANFGLEHDNYIGSLAQPNDPHDNWITFFIERRLKPQLALASDSGRVPDFLVHQFEKLFARLPQLLVEEQPSLLHGDLWSGNLMTNEHGMPCLIDPAVYYGNREVDLAMTQLFGGFNSTFLHSYHETFPLAPGFNERIELYQLYPLLVHVNLFGGGYAAQVQSIVKRFAAR